MQINLITAEEYATLLTIQKEYPKLTFQNVGFEYIGRSNLTDEEKLKIKEVEVILKKAVTGFSEFNNFKLDRAGELQLRFQYDWTAHDRSLGIPFTGVGYILLDELLNGFRETA